MFTPVTNEQVFNVISKLSTSKSCGLDKIQSKLLKLTTTYISEIIRDIIDQSFDTGIFPDDWKKAKVSLVYKADGRNAPDNYRPISILLLIPKVIERIVHTQVLEFFPSLLSKFQSGFPDMHSTCTALLFVKVLWLRNIDEGYTNRYTNVFSLISKTNQ